MKRAKKFIDLPFEEQDKSNTVRFFVNKEKKTTVCVVYDRMTGRSYTGTTHCHDCDTFDEGIGRKIAFNKARVKELTAGAKYTMDEIRELTNTYNMLMKRLEKRVIVTSKYLKEIADDLNTVMK